MIEISKFNQIITIISLIIFFVIIYGSCIDYVILLIFGKILNILLYIPTTIAYIMNILMMIFSIIIIVVIGIYLLSLITAVYLLK